MIAGTVDGAPTVQKNCTSHQGELDCRSGALCNSMFHVWRSAKVHKPEVGSELVRGKRPCLLSKSRRTSILFLTHSSSTLARSCVAILLPQSGSFDAPLAVTSIESKTALHASEHCLSFKPRHLSQEGPEQPSVCVIISHDFRHVPRPRLCRLDVQACQKHCRPYHTAMFQHASSFFLPFPVLLYQICHHNLQVLATYSVNPSNAQSLPAPRFSLLLRAKNDARCRPL